MVRPVCSATEPPPSRSLEVASGATKNPHYGARGPTVGVINPDHWGGPSVGELHHPTGGSRQQKDSKETIPWSQGRDKTAL